MPVKYSVVKDLDCFSNRLLPPGSYELLNLGPRMNANGSSVAYKNSRGQLDAEIGRPAPDRMGKTRVLQVEIRSGLANDAEAPLTVCGVERLSPTCPPR